MFALMFFETKKHDHFEIFVGVWSGKTGKNWQNNAKKLGTKWHFKMAFQF